MMSVFLHDARYALRTLRRSPGFALAVVVTLALGIGANTAVFSLTDAVLFRPLPVRDPDRLAVLYSTRPEPDRYGGLSYLDYLDYAGPSAVFDGVLAYRLFQFSFEGTGRTEMIWAELVSANYFEVLGLRMPLGRGFRPEEERLGSQVAVISYALWQASFGGDAGVLGRTIRIQGLPFTIARGASPSVLEGRDWGSPPEIWAPLAMTDQVVTGFRGDILKRRELGLFMVLARLRPGSKLEQARAEVATRARRLELAYPETNRGVGAGLLPERDARFWPNNRRSIVLFLGLLATVAALILVLACATVANLLLARAAARRREIAIRLALGAGRIRLLRQLAAEALVLSALGLVPALAVALGATLLLARFPLAFAVPLNIEIGLDRRMSGIAVLVALVTTVAFGLLPAADAWRLRLRDALQDRSGAGMRRSRLRRALVVVQVSLSFVLLAGAGLFIRTLRAAQEIRPGFEASNVLVLSVSFNAMAHRYDERRAMAFYRAVLERVGTLPGVSSVSWGGDVPLATRQLLLWFVPGEHEPAREEDWIRTGCNIVGPRYMETLGIPLVRGRDFTARDDEGATLGALIINETMARRYWPGVDPVGKRVTVRRRARTLYEVVGVAKDVRQRSLWDDPVPYLYLPLLQRYFPEMMLHVKTAGDPMALAPAVRREIEAIDGDLPVFDVMPLRNQITTALSPQRMAAALLGFSGALALVLAALGVYGVTAYSVAQRTQEIGIRMALGAERRAIFRLVLGEGMALVAIGVALGLGAALASTRLVAGYLHGVGARDPATFAAVPVLLGAVALAACYVPSLKATRIDPIAALRQE